MWSLIFLYLSNFQIQDKTLTVHENMIVDSFISRNIEISLNVPEGPNIKCLFTGYSRLFQYKKIQINWRFHFESVTSG